MDRHPKGQGREEQCNKGILVPPSWCRAGLERGRV